MVGNLRSNYEQYENTPQKQLPAAGLSSLLQMGKIDSETSFTPGIYENLTRKGQVKIGNKPYTL